MKSEKRNIGLNGILIAINDYLENDLIDIKSQSYIYNFLLTFFVFTSVSFND